MACRFRLRLTMTWRTPDYVVVPLLVLLLQPALTLSQSMFAVRLKGMEPDWTKAACKGTHIDTWHPETAGLRGAPRQGQPEPTKVLILQAYDQLTICASCPILEGCDATATLNQSLGIVGGKWRAISVGWRTHGRPYYATVDDLETVTPEELEWWRQNIRPARR